MSAAQRGTACRLGGAPVLLYHDLDESDRGSDRHVLAWRSFVAQMAELRRGSWPVVSLAQLWSREGPPPPGRPPVVLSFDDGYASGYELAFPLLVEMEAPAEFFVNPATVGRPGFLTWSQVREMREAGMGIQSHSFDHVDLTRLSAVELASQLRDSRREIEDRTVAPVEFLAAPYGLVNRRVADAAVAEGYRGVATSWSWPARPAARLVNRVAIYRHTTLIQFRRLVARDLRTYAARSARAAILHVPKALVLRLWPAALGVSVLEQHA